MSKKLILNTERIELELKIRERSKAWLARQLDITSTAMYSWFQRKNPNLANPIGKILGINPKYLVTTERDHEG